MSARALECAEARAEQWVDLADRLEARGVEPERVARLRGMAAGARYVIADHRHGTNPDDVRASSPRKL